MNRNDMKELRQILAPLVRKLNTMVSRGTIKNTDDSGSYQTMQVESMEKTRDEVMRIQQYGFYSNPSENSEALVLNIAGNNFQMIVAVDNPSTRKKDLEEKELGMFHEEGHFIHMKNNGELHIKAEKILIECPETKFGSAGAMGKVLTTLSDPVVDNITGAPSSGVSYILSDL